MAPPLTPEEQEARRAAGLSEASEMPAPPDSLLDKLATADKVEVWQLKKGVRDQYCGRFPKDKFNADPSFIGNEYGPGDYRVWGIDSSGHYIKGEVGEISMAGVAFKEPEPPKPQRQVVGPMTEAAAMVAAIVGGLSAVAKEVAPMFANRVDPTTQLVNLLTAIKKIDGDGAGGGKGGDALESFIRGMELGRSVVGPGSTAVAITTAVEKVATRYLDMVDPNVVKRVRELPHTNGKNGAGGGNGHDAPDGVKVLSFEERFLLEKVCGMFAEKTDAEEAAATLMNTIGPAYMPKLDEFVSKAEAVDTLVTADARLKDAKPWLNSVMDFLRPMAKQIADKVRAAQSEAPQSAAT